MLGIGEISPDCLVYSITAIYVMLYKVRYEIIEITVVECTLFESERTLPLVQSKNVYNKA